MRSHFARRIPLPVRAPLVLAVLAFGFLAVVGVRSLVAGTASASPDAPNPGHLWTDLEGHGISYGTDDYWLGTTGAGQALELRVNNARALRLEPMVQSPNVIAGSSWNSVSGGAAGATIAGGWIELGNRVTDHAGTVGGGLSNRAGDDAGDAVSAEGATVGGGFINTAGGRYATVAGGRENSASLEGSTVSGGEANIASGQWATVPGGLINQAQGDYSFAAGYHAKANHPGSFVWADYHEEKDFASTLANEFSVRSTNGARVVTAIDVDGLPTAGVKLDAGDSAWEELSDRAAKENFVTVDPQLVLSRLSEIPISEWNYKAQDSSIRHIGPTAQDFYAAFGLSDDELYISPIDTDGVALAAIQGLYQLSQEQGARIQALEEENAALKQRLDGLETRVSALEGGTTVDAAVSQASASGLPGTWLGLGGGVALVLGGLVLARHRLAGGRR